MERFFKTGTGWRLGWDSNNPTYQGLVGTDEWAIELTSAEFKDFLRLAAQLKDTMEHMATELMDQEKITCEAETDLLWLEAHGYPHSYTLRLILQQGRRAEGTWSPSVISELFQALETFTIF